MGKTWQGESFPINHNVTDEYIDRNLKGDEVEKAIIDYFVRFLEHEYHASVYELIDLEIEAWSTNKTQKQMHRKVMKKCHKDSQPPHLLIGGIEQNQTRDGTCGYAMLEAAGVSKRTVN